MNEVDKKIEQALYSLDSILPAQAPAFFAPRLKAKMENKLDNAQPNFWLLKQPIYALAFTLILIACSVYLLLQQTNAKTTVEVRNPAATIQDFATEYNLNTNSFNY